MHYLLHSRRFSSVGERKKKRKKLSLVPSCIHEREEKRPPKRRKRERGREREGERERELDGLLSSFGSPEDGEREMKIPRRLSLSL